MNNRLAMETLGGNTVLKRKISNLPVSLFKRDTVIKCIMGTWGSNAFSLCDG